MKAIAVENPGPHYRLVLHELLAPKPGAGQVLIKVAGAGLNNVLVANGGDAFRFQAVGRTHR